MLDTILAEDSILDSSIVELITEDSLNPVKKVLEVMPVVGYNGLQTKVHYDTHFHS